MATKTRLVSTKTYDPHPAVPEQKAQQGGRIKLLSHGEERGREGESEERKVWEYTGGLFRVQHS